MAVGAGSITPGTSTSAVASQTVVVTTTGARCAVLWAITYAVGTSVFTTATIDGVACPAVTGGAAADTAIELGHVKAYFLDNINQGANLSFTVNRTNNATLGKIVAQIFTALGACEVHLPGIVLLQEDGTFAEQSVDDGSPGTNSVRVACGYYGGASPAPMGANTTGFTSDETSFGSSYGAETTAGQGSRSVGFTQATLDDRAAVHFAIREVPGPAVKRPCRRVPMRARQRRSARAMVGCMVPSGFQVPDLSPKPVLLG